MTRASAGRPTTVERGHQTSRLAALDGLRGVASLLVVFSHLVAAFVPAMYFGDGDSASTLLGKLAKSPLFVAWSGTFAVYVFFVLSGFVIAASAAKGNFSLLRAAIARYVRLALPMLASCLVAWMLIRSFGNAAMEAAALSGNPWLAVYADPVPSLGQAFAEPLWLAFIYPNSWFNGVLWTMHYELVGSVCIYAAYRLLPTSAVIILAVALLPVLAYFSGSNFHFLGFPVGVLIFEAWRRNALPSLPAVFVIAGLLVGGYPFAPAAGTPYQLFDMIFGPASFGNTRTLGASLLIMGVLTSGTTQRILCSAVPQFLGRISFSLYLLHLPILLTVLVRVYVVSWGQPILFAFAIGGYLMVTIGAAEIFTRLIDGPSVRLARSTRFATKASPVRV